MSEFLYDDDYTGPRWRYALLLRPMHWTHVPAGWVLKSNRRHIDYPHGTVDYPHRLPDDDVHHFDLKLIMEILEEPKKARVWITADDIVLRRRPRHKKRVSSSSVKRK